MHPARFIPYRIDVASNRANHHVFLREWDEQPVQDSGSSVSGSSQ